MSPSDEEARQPMKVLLVLHNIVHFRYLGEVVQHLCHNGHTVKILFAEGAKKNTSDRALRACLNEVNAAEFEFMPEGTTNRLPRYWGIRNWISYAHYFRPDHPSRSLEKRWRRHLPLWVRVGVWTPIGRKLLVSAPVQKVLQRIRQRIPIDPDITRRLKEYRPDVVIATPFLKEDSVEVDFVRATAALGIPTIVNVLSWDNLTSKGVFHAVPDMTLVWNQALVKEAVELHDLPPHKVFVTGAPTFDFWFDMQPSLSRAAFCEQVGLNANAPFILYLGSSKSIAPDETPYLQQFAAHLRERSDCRQVQILVRPHPLNFARWKSFSAEGIAVWPRGGEWPDSPESKQDYFNSLFYSEAVMGVNTSGFLDAAIVDKPCVTAITDHYRHTQTGRGHFAHLLNGGFLDIAHSLSEAASLIAALLRGQDTKADQRRHFVREFVRPYGLEQRASEIFARAVEMVAQGMSAAQMEERLKRIASVRVE